MWVTVVALVTMAQFVHPAIEDARTEPTPGASIIVVLVLEDDTVAASAASTVQRMDGASLERELDTGMLLVDARETALDELCGLSGVKSVSPDKEMEILA